MDKMKNAKKILKYSLIILIIFTFVNSYFCSMVEVEAELDSNIRNTPSTTEEFFTLFEPKEEKKNISKLFSQRAEHVSNVCRHFKEDIPRLGYKSKLKLKINYFNNVAGKLREFRT